MVGGVSVIRAIQGIITLGKLRDEFIIKVEVCIGETARDIDIDIYRAMYEGVILSVV